MSGNGYESTPCALGCDDAAGCKTQCEPGAVLGCSNDTLSSCDATGNGTVQESCALGCASSGARCATFTPSNGLKPALEDSATQPDVVIPSGSRIDTDLGLIENSSGNPIAVKRRLLS